MADNTKIFREKSLDRVSSPEQLDKYIKTTTPSLWLLLISIIVILFGILFWGIVGKIETSSEIGMNVTSENAYIYIKESDYSRISEETYVVIDEKQYEILEVSGPFEANEQSDSFLLHAANIEKEEWYYIVTIKTDLKIGNYKGKIVYEIISPISFVLN